MDESINLEESVIDPNVTADEPSLNNTLLKNLRNPVQDEEDEPIYDDSDDEGMMKLSPEGVPDACDEEPGVPNDSDSNDSGELRDAPTDSQGELEDDTETNEVAVVEEKPKCRPLRVKPWQEELFKNSLDENSIIYLPTGCGKTLVSILAMHYYFIKHGFEKKVVFLANTIQLVKQQAVAIKKYLPRISGHKTLVQYMNSKVKRSHLVEFTEDNVKERVVCLHGEKNEQMGMTQRRLIETNIRDRRQLMNKIKGATVVVMIAQMFLNCLRRGYTKLQDYVLVVFDECHHCEGDHPFGSIMREFYFEEQLKQQNLMNGADTEVTFQDKLPYIMGLTASPINTVFYDPEKLQSECSKLCRNLDSDYVYYDYRKMNESKNECDDIEIIKIEEEKSSIDELFNFYKVIQNEPKSLEASLEKMKTYFPLMYELITQMNSKIRAKDGVLSPPVKELFHELQKSLLVRAANIWLQLGKYAFYLVLEDLTGEFTNLVPKKDTEIKKEIDELLIKYLGRMRMHYGNCIEENMSKKFMTLYKTIKEEVQESEKRILVFAFERRIVKYLQRVFNDFVEKLEPEQKMKFISESVCGVSAARRMTNENSEKDEYANPSDIQRMKIDARTRHLEFEAEQKQFGGNPNESMNNALRGQQRKYDNSKLAKLMLEPQEKYDRQIEAIKGFRANSIPILFTTSVTEEGFDIPHCNMVISFDRPQTLKSFIQIKGRAREASSKYKIFVNTLDYPIMSKYLEQYQATITVCQEIAIQKLAKRVGNPRSGVPKRRYTRQDTYQVAVIKGSGAIINTNNSVEILKSYMNNLRGTGEAGKKIFQYYAGTSSTGYICHLVLPGCQLDVVTGDLQRTKRDALRSSAFIAVKELRKLKQIREDLRPKNEAELTEERDFQKFNDMHLLRTDTQYAEIFRKHVRIQVNKEKATEKFFFESIKSNDLDFPKINSEFRKAVYGNSVNFESSPQGENSQYNGNFKTKPFPFQLYRIVLSGVDQQVRDSRVNSATKGLELGILTCFQEQDIKEIFSGFRYEVKKGSHEFYSLELVDAALLLKQEEYERLWRIHSFMLCASMNQELRYFVSYLSHVTLSVPSWRTKVTEPKFNYEIDTKRKFHPLFVMLQRDKTDKKKLYLSEEQNRKIIEYERMLGEVYCFHNKFRESGEKSKLSPEVTKYIEENMMDFQKQYQEETYKNMYILQSITSDFLLNKVIVQGKENINKGETNLKGRIYDQRPTKGKAGKDLMDYSARHSQLKRIFKHAESNFDCLVTFNVLRKRLKQLSQDYLTKDDGLTKTEDEPNQWRFLSEFVKHPLDLETIFTLLIARDHIMPKVLDYTRAYYFRTCRLKEIEDEGFRSAIKPPIYQLKTARNLIDKNYDKLTILLQENNSVKMRQLGKSLEKGFNANYQWPLKDIQIKIEKEKLDQINSPTRQWEQGPLYSRKSIHNSINVTEVLRAITSRIYKSNRIENYEYYEFIGDCVLKLLATIQVFVEGPQRDEGELHLARAAIISNSNLHTKSIKKQLFRFILTNPSEEPSAPFKFKELPDSKQQEYYKDTGIKIMDEKGAHEGYFYVPGKYHADIIEALVGVYYMQAHRRLDDCQFLLYSLGVLEYPSLRFDYSFEDVPLERPCFRQVQQRLMHKFNNKNLIYQAFTHYSFESILTSCVNKELADLRKKLQQSEANFQDISKAFSEQYTKKVMSSKIEKHQLFYERLEFLGDSVLDLVAVEYINEKHDNLDEGMYSLLKQASVSNRSLGLVALYWGLDEFIMIDSRESIDAFADIKRNFNHFYTAPYEIYTSEMAPLKVLGDVFEAYIGAVFLDSQFNYIYTRNICRRLMLPFIDHFTSTEMIKHYPQYKMVEYLKSNNFEGVRVVKDCNNPQANKNGEYEYVLMDKSNNIINRCHAPTEKKAWDQLTELYLEQQSQS